MQGSLFSSFTPLFSPPVRAAFAKQVRSFTFATQYLILSGILYGRDHGLDHGRLCIAAHEMYVAHAMSPVELT